MINAYILIVVASGAEEAVMKKLSKAPEVSDIRIVYGEYDLIALVKVKEMNDLQKFIIKNIRAIKEVDRTSTMICVN
ncbi:MAG: Lrp/AsnC ligand binding domain-containing protein [Nanoarchaeota archaeon]|nr:Lrp/AsnC ligand binding domain-containing protein [Nanoarchaeota archaeon]